MAETPFDPDAPPPDGAPDQVFVPIPRALTAEEIADLRRRTAEKAVIGDLTYQSLPLFQEGTKCIKCGHGETEVQYHDSHRGRHQACASAAGNHEHLHRACRRCSYSWIERVLQEEA